MNRGIDLGNAHWKEAVKGMPPEEIARVAEEYALSRCGYRPGENPRLGLLVSIIVLVLTCLALWIVSVLLRQ